MGKSTLGSNGTESFTQDQIERCSGALAVAISCFGEKSLGN